MKNVKTKGYFYDVKNDLEEYQNAWCYLIIGGRNTGKTYSTLKYYALTVRQKFVFMKRTMEDVDLLCAGSGKKRDDAGMMDLSPFKAINRDFGTDIYPYQVRKGIGGFYRYVDGEIDGLPIGYIMSLSGVTKFKGFDLSDADAIIFDEFIPAKWDRVNRKEGSQLLSLYKTISRDREHRGKEALKLICLANADSIVNPTMETLEVVDVVADMQLKGESVRYIDDRGILIRRVVNSASFDEVEKNSPLYKAMGQTSWGISAFENEFGYDDFSAVGRMSLKKLRPCCSMSYKKFNYYIYINDVGCYYMTKSKHNLDSEIYNLNQENDQKLFFIEWHGILKNASINHKMIFETYSMYDLIINYKKIFSL